jgi:hypothetical protein
MDRDDEARQGDTGMIGSEAEEPGPGRDTSLTEPDPVATSTEQPQTTVGMSEGDPMRTRLGSHVEGAGAIGFDVAASEEGTTQETPPEDRPAYEPEDRLADEPTSAATTPLTDDRDPGLAAEPLVDRGSYDDVGRADSATFADEPSAAEGSAFAADDAGSPDREAVVYDQEADPAGERRPADER